MDEITLNQVEQALVRYVAKQRHEYDKRFKKKAVEMTSMTALENHIQAHGAEIAFCKMMNCYPDMGIDNLLYYDVILHDGRTVDIKHTTYSSGMLMVKEGYRRPGPDVYVLMVGKFPTYKYIGQMSASEVLRSENFNRTFDYPCYAIPQNRLIREPVGWNMQSVV